MTPTSLQSLARQHPETATKVAWAVWGTWAAVLLVHLLPRLLLGERSIVIQHDNLDSDFLYRVLINRPGRLFDFDAQVPELMGGMPRSIFPSALKLSSLLFAVLPIFWAYVALEMCVRSIAFAGMYLLIRDHIPTRPALGQNLLIAATFATLPYYVIYDASVAGQAWAAWALLNLWQARRIAVSLVSLALYPFVSVLATSGAFVVAAAGGITLIAALICRRLPLWVVAGLAALLVGHIVSDYWFIRVMVDPPYVSHRSVWMQPGSSRILDFSQLMARSVYTFLYGGYHSASLHSLILAGVVLTALTSLLTKRWQHARWMLAILGVGALLAVSGAFTKWGGLEPIWEVIPFTRMVNMRFHWSMPTLWFAALALMTGLWAGLSRRQHWLYVALLINLAWVVVSGPEGNGELKPSYQVLLTSSKPLELSYREFVAQRLFARIDAAIGQPKSSYRVISLGLHPSVAMLNGFHTADGYSDNYPLAYKQRFEKLIAGQLGSDTRRKFREWGSRAYVYVPHKKALDLNRRQTKGHQVLDKLALDPAALEDLGVKYIFSAYELRGAALGGFLRSMGEFSDAEAAWRVYLYEVVR